MTDATFATLADEIEAAKAALLELLRADPRPWHAYDLKTRARNGWTAGSVNLALDGLIADGTLRVTDDMQVELVP